MPNSTTTTNPQTTGSYPLSDQQISDVGSGSFDAGLKLLRNFSAKAKGVEFIEPKTTFCMVCGESMPCHVYESAINDMTRLEKDNSCGLRNAARYVKDLLLQSVRKTHGR